MAKRNTKRWYGYGAWWRKFQLNRKYKDVLFRKIFHDKQDLLELYNALNDSTYASPEELEVVTMEDVIFMKMKNDLSFIIGSSIHLYEHQSTWNPNMLRREAVETAIDTCIQKGILTDILMSEKAEVTHMLLTEYDEKRHLRNTFLEGLEEGLQKGRKEGIIEGQESKLRELVHKKLERGKTLREIADDLEEETAVIERIAAAQKRDDK